jgi:hypothetical protein
MPPTEVSGGATRGNKMSNAAPAGRSYPPAKKRPKTREGVAHALRRGDILERCEALEKESEDFLRDLIDLKPRRWIPGR